MSEEWEEKGASLGALRIIPGIREGFIPESVTGMKGRIRPLALALRFYYYLPICR